MRHLLACCAAVLAIALAPARADDPPALPTVAESSDYRATSTSDQVRAFLDELAQRSERLHVSELGRTNEDRAIPLAILADPPITTADEARKSKKLLVLLVGTIHAGEVDGKEAILALTRDLALADESPLLKDLIVAVVPNFNPDGNDRIAKDTRPGQAGPAEGQGTRENAQGLDLNRDFTKLETPEVRALVGFMNEWDPAIILDAHTTNGSYHRYTLTYGGPKHPAGDAAIIEFVRDTMLPAIDQAVEAESGYKTFFYGNFDQAHTRWEDYPAQPRFGAPYIGLRNRIPILTESYAYAPYKDRVLVQHAFIRETLEYAAANKDKIRKLIKEADERTTDAGREPSPDDTIALRTKAVPAPEKATLLGYVEEQADGRARPTDEPRDYEVDLLNRFEPTLTVPRPYAYIVPATHASLVETLQRHGVEVEQLREDLELDVQVYTIDRLDRAQRPFQGHHRLTIDATGRDESRRLEAGAILVRTGQRLGTLAAYLLEPEAEDGLASWNFLDEFLAPGQPFPILRLPQPAPVVRAPVPPLPEDRKSAQPFTFEVLHGDDAPNFNGDPVGGLDWLPDGEHFLQRKDGKLWKVHAARGRAEPALDTDPIADALAKIPALDADAARNLARRAPSNTNDDRTAALLEHENDLYWVALDGSEARRLTSTPEREELAAFSPDGRFVAFVRSNDLWIVDVQTATERALTTGGHDLLRSGKADWVYYEEVFDRNWRTFWWSPDSAHIAFMQVDSSPIDTFTLVNDLPDEQEVEQAPYPKPGTPNPVARLGIVGVAGGPPRWADLGAYDAGNYLIAGVGWWPDASAVYACITNRTQTWVDLLRVPPRGGKPRRLFRDQTQAWVEPPFTVHFLDDGRFLWESERTGWNHLYLYDRNGKEQHAVTSGEWEVRGVEHVDQDSRRIYFTATRDSPIASNLYRVGLDEGSPIERLTLEPGSHRVSVSPNGAYFIDSWSTHAQPPRVALRSTSGGGLVRTLDANPVPDLDKYRLSAYRLVQIPTEDGFTLEGAVLLPPDLDASKKYPVWFTTYGGPHAPSVSDSWHGGRAWDHALAGEGFIVFRADPRSASGKGATSAWTAYKQLGVQELKDIEAALDWLLAEHPYADPDRIGISGHSYGGFMTAYAMTHSERFAAGIAGAPVTDWRDYDSIYTERYMSTPGENPDGYDKTSVVKAAKDLHGRLLLLHGLLDDNVHAQNSWRLVKALQDAGKDFEIMFYPQARHGLWGKHYQRLTADFILRTLGRPEPAGTHSAPTLDPAGAPPEDPAEITGP